MVMIFSFPSFRLYSSSAVYKTFCCYWEFRVIPHQEDWRWCHELGKCEILRKGTFGSCENKKKKWLAGNPSVPFILARGLSFPCQCGLASVQLLGHPTWWKASTVTSWSNLGLWPSGPCKRNRSFHLLIIPETSGAALPLPPLFLSLCFPPVFLSILW